MPYARQSPILGQRENALQTALAMMAQLQPISDLRVIETAGNAWWLWRLTLRCWYVKKPKASQGGGRPRSRSDAL